MGVRYDHMCLVVCVVGVVLPAMGPCDHAGCSLPQTVLIHAYLTRQEKSISQGLRQALDGSWPQSLTRTSAGCELLAVCMLRLGAVFEQCFPPCNILCMYICGRFELRMSMSRAYKYAVSGVDDTFSWPYMFCYGIRQHLSSPTRAMKLNFKYSGDQVFPDD